MVHGFFSAVPGLSLVTVQGLLAVVRALLMLWCAGSKTQGLKGCGMRALFSRSVWDLSSLTRDRTHIPCIGRQSLNHWTTGKFQYFLFMSS